MRKILLTLPVLAVLAGCGGSGTAKEAKAEAERILGLDNPSNSSGNSQGSNSGSSGNSGSQGTGNGSGSGSSGDSAAADPDVFVSPDGKKFDLSISPKGWVSSKTDAGTVTGYNQNDSFYGAWIDDSSQVGKLFYQGKVATNIPQYGTATYVGHVVRVNALTKEINNEGTSRLNVDFGAKTVEGHLSMPLFQRDITLHKGKLEGAAFSGKASVLFNDGGRYQGHLLGKGATEAAGMVQFDNNTGLNAVFGGKRY